VWAYKVGTLGEYIYEPTIPPPVGTIPSTGAQDFEISDVDQTELILKILAYAGVVIRDPQIIQAASAAVQQQDQLEAS